jgi:hypothetical protein
MRLRAGEAKTRKGVPHSFSDVACERFGSGECIHRGVGWVGHVFFIVIELAPGYFFEEGVLELVCSACKTRDDLFN